MTTARMKGLLPRCCAVAPRAAPCGARRARGGDAGGRLDRRGDRGGRDRLRHAGLVGARSSPPFRRETIPCCTRTSPASRCSSSSSTPPLASRAGASIRGARRESSRRGDYPRPDRHRASCPHGDPHALDLAGALAPPSLDAPLGRDHLGRDLAARLAAGAQPSLVAIAIGLGATLVGGVLAGLPRRARPAGARHIGATDRRGDARRAVSRRRPRPRRGAGAPARRRPGSPSPRPPGRPGP